MSRLALVPFTLVSVVELVSDSESCIALIGACVMSGASLLVSIRSCLSYATDKVLKNEHSRRYDPAFPGNDAMAGSPPLKCVILEVWGGWPARPKL